MYLYTPEDERYLDFAGGMAVIGLGHCHPHVTNALHAQADKLWHVSNLYSIPEMERLATRLAERTFADNVFFTNSGAEAVECGIKMVRKYHDECGNPEKYRMITFTGAFHGRTMATISAGDRAKVMAGFEPALDGFDNVEFHNLDAVKAAITPQTGGILIEAVQGEGGIRVCSDEFLSALRELCDQHGMLLMFDGVQCGMGRTGKLYSYEWSGVKPDILASAKAIGNGFPLGACLATTEAAKGMKPGTHGSTYGCNPLAMAVGNAVLDIMFQDGFMEHVVVMGDYLQDGLKSIAADFPNLIELVRGRGLMIGVKMRIPNTEMVETLRDAKLLTALASDNIVRFLPPLIIEQQHADAALAAFRQACEKLSTKY